MKYVKADTCAARERRLLFAGSDFGKNQSKA